MKRPVRLSITLFCILVLLAAMLGFLACGKSSVETNGNANALTGTPTPKAPTCGTDTPAMILKAIYDALEASKYAPQEFQFNISISTDGKTLSIAGWSPDYQAIADLVGKSVSGCTVNTGNFKAAYCDLDPNFRLIRSCNPGYYPCGDICVLIGETCRINSVDGPNHGGTNYNCASPTPTPSAGPTTGNSNGNGNSNGKTNTNAKMAP